MESRCGVYKPRRWSTEKDAQLLALRRTGMCWKLVAKALGVTERAASMRGTRIGAVGIVPRYHNQANTPWTAERLILLNELRRTVVWTRPMLAPLNALPGLPITFIAVKLKIQRMRLKERPKPRPAAPLLPVPAVPPTPLARRPRDWTGGFTMLRK